MIELYKIDEKDLDRKEILEFIHTREESHFYWSDNWSPSFYSRLAYEGLISTSYQLKDEGFVLLPEMQKAYALLDWENLHISKQSRKLLNHVEKGEYFLSLNTDFEQVLHKITLYHDSCWLNDKYADILRFLHQRIHPYACKVQSVELYNSQNLMIAGELGYRIGTTYTSLSGFTDKEKGPGGCGTLQMLLLARLLEEQGMAFWNLGHPYMEYKDRLGAVNLKREDFLKRWKKCRDNPRF